MRPTTLAALVLASAALAAPARGHAAPTSAARTAHARAVLPFIADDYERALHEARARKVPIFIEAWAPW